MSWVEYKVGLSWVDFEYKKSWYSNSTLKTTVQPVFCFGENFGRTFLWMFGVKGEEGELFLPVDSKVWGRMSRKKTVQSSITSMGFPLLQKSGQICVDRQIVRGRTDRVSGKVWNFKVNRGQSSSNVQCSGFMFYTSSLEVVLPLKQWISRRWVWMDKTGILNEFEVMWQLPYPIPLAFWCILMFSNRLLVTCNWCQCGISFGWDNFQKVILTRTPSLTWFRSWSTSSRTNPLSKISCKSTMRCSETRTRRKKKRFQQARQPRTIGPRLGHRWVN